MLSSSVKTFSLETFSLADSMCVRFEFLTALISETFVFWEVVTQNFYPVDGSSISEILANFCQTTRRYIS